MIVLAALVIGLAAGWAASLLVRRPTTPGQQLAVGVAGSLVGGTLAGLVAGDGFDLRLSGLLGSILGAAVVLLVWDVVAREAGEGGRGT